MTSAVESVDDEVLGKLRKGHTRADFIAAVGRCREAGITLSPTFVPFTPWTTLEGYVDLLDQIAALDLIGVGGADTARDPAAGDRRFGAAGAAAICGSWCSRSTADR